MENSTRLNLGTDNRYYLGLTSLSSFVSLYDKGALKGGVVEVCRRGQYVTICADYWNNIDASVVCQQLGYSKYGNRSCDNYHAIINAPLHKQEPLLYLVVSWEVPPPPPPSAALRAQAMSLLCRPAQWGPKHLDPAARLQALCVS